MELNELKTIRTGITAVDWLISKGVLFDFSDEVFIDYNIIFTGTLKPSMVSEIRKAVNTRGNIVIKDNEKETIMIAIDFGKTQSTRNKVGFKLSYTAYK
jgi:hypothetical protein